MTWQKRGTVTSSKGDPRGARNSVSGSGGLPIGVSPLSGRFRMAVLEVLPEVIGPVGLLGRIARPELMRVVEVARTLDPILLHGTRYTASCSTPRGCCVGLPPPEEFEMSTRHGPVRPVT